MRNLPLSNLAQLSRTSRPKRHFLPAIYQLLTPRNRPFSQNSTLELVAHLKSQTQALIDHLKTQRNSLEQRFSTLSQEISKVSGYANIEELKHSVTEAGQPATNA